MEFEYITRGTCSRKISFDLDDQNRLSNVVFWGGCHGNTQGLSALLEGMDALVAVKRLKGINCGAKATSCPDQLAQAIEKALSAKTNS